MPIEDYSTTPSNNDTAGSVNLAEGQAPNTINDSMRQVLADIRTQHEDAEWICLADTPTYVSATSFTIPGNVTTRYHVGRRLKLYGSAMGTVYATITASSYSAPNTTITVSTDSGTLGATLSKVWHGITSMTNSSMFQSGTWTPTLITTGTNFSSVTYDAARQGTYKRIGDLVYIQFYMQTDAITVGSASGILCIGGLPFTAFSSGVQPITVYSNSFNISANTLQPSVGAIIPSTSYMYLLHSLLSTGAFDNMAYSDAATGANTNIVYGSGWYRV